MSTFRKRGRDSCNFQREGGGGLDSGRETWAMQRNMIVRHEKKRDTRPPFLRVCLSNRHTNNWPLVSLLVPFTSWYCIASFTRSQSFPSLASVWLRESTTFDVSLRLSLSSLSRSQSVYTTHRHLESSQKFALSLSLAYFTQPLISFSYSRLSSKAEMSHSRS